ncbi:uncharacterized protein [Dysidea avara]|uniref:uncharacterized protein isoform X1 n=2 Tax=Dysidea avara TaxID=196820 RepID=UPI0033330374
MVESAHCTCMAGLGEVCSHVGAILFYLESANRTRITCTQVGCVWKAPSFVEAIPYLPIAGLLFSMPKSRISCNKKRGAHLMNETVPLDQSFDVPVVREHSASSGSSGARALASVSVPPSDEEQSLFLKDIAKCKPVVCSIVPAHSDAFRPTSVAVKLPPSLCELLYKPDNEELTYTELLVVCDEVTLTITEEEANVIETHTRNQARNTAWFMQRAGRITASKMKSVCGTDVSNPAQSLISSICYPQLHKFTTRATTWGCEHEAIARISFIDMAKPLHTNFEYRDSGLVIHRDHPYIGASPDGIVQCSCCGYGVLEIKCPYCIREQDPNQASCLEDGKLSKKHPYYYQIQTQLCVCSADYADFVLAIFSDGNPNLYHERIYPDEQKIGECINHAEAFFKICLLPELLAKWYSRKVVMPDQTVSASVVNSKYIYCYCKKDIGGEMVGCDNPDCKHGSWFHLVCLKIPKPRSCKWYCPDCRRMPEFTRKRSRK